jgi:autotransporter-associated beta strand protein
MNDSARAATHSINTGAGAGNWTALTWTNGVPNGAGEIANETGTAATFTTTLDANITIGQLQANAGSSGGQIWTIGGTSFTLTLNNSGGSNNPIGTSAAFLGATGRQLLMVQPNVFIVGDLVIGQTAVGANSNALVTIGASANSAGITSALGSGTHTVTVATRGDSGTGGGILVNDSIGATQTGGSGADSTINVIINNGAVTAANKAVTIAGNLGGTNGTASIVTLSNTHAGSGTVTVSGLLGQSVTSVTQNSSTSTMILSGANTSFAGAVAVTAGTLQLGNIAALNSSNTVTMSLAGTLNINGNNQTIGGLNGSAGTVTNSGAATTLTLGGSGSYSYGGILTATTPANLAVIKSGSGVQTLSGASTYAGGTTVSGGVLLISNTTGSGTGTGAVVVSSVGTLGGSGTISGATTINDGTLSPGNSPGILSFSSALTLSGNSTNSVFELASGARGTNYDGVNVAGAMTYDGTLTLSIAALLADDTYNLFDFASDSGDFDTLTFAGFYSGSFSNLSGVWTATSAGQQFVFSESTGDLVVTAVPEPSAVVLVGLGLGSLWLLRRKKIIEPQC